MRKLRLKPEKDGVCYHIMNRTAQAKWWFDEHFRKIVYDRITFFAKVYYVDLYAVTCMSNHYHICLNMRRPELDRGEVKQRFEILQTFRARPRKWCGVLAEKWHERFCDLSKLMWDINRSLSDTFNKTNETSGHLWGSRFKSLLVESDDSLLKVMSYIELNPVRAGIVEDPREYPFGSVGRLTHPEWGEAGIDIPPTGFLRCTSPKKRIRKYLPWLLALAKAIRGEKLAISTCGLIPKSAPALEDIVADFSSGSMTNWNHQAYGSQMFHREVQKDLNSYAHRLRVFRIEKQARASPNVS